ncbi:HNH endonuclease [Polyangium jinanense]|uniref:HNH endonuclease n=1 Tax=Polyangium jinanense TaxID=2829994 RepID=UPI00233FFE4E|nr:HNH endonuclease [Polyangium jinanense]MDC3955763.1 HNH endonuclease [Polyangium jinanense]
MARRDAEEEARRIGERIGREWGATLGKADGVRDSINVVYLGNFGYDIRDKADSQVFEDIRTNLAQQLDAIPDLPTYDDEGLAKIAWEAFLKGYGKGWADAELKFAILNALADALLMVGSGGAAALETAGARVLRAAQQRLRSMPVFLPSAAGGPGGLLRRPKLPSAPAPSPPTASTPPNGTTVKTTTQPRAGGSAGGPRAGKLFTAKGKAEIDAANAARNGGVNVCETCGSQAVPAQKSQRGVRPPGNERHRDHQIPRSKGGNGDPSNGQILCRDCNLKKGDTL